MKIIKKITLKGFVLFLMVLISFQTLILLRNTNHLNALKRDQESLNERHIEILESSRLL